MKIPAFSAISAERKSSDTDTTEITLRDNNGNTHTVNLSAQAHVQLITALLSTPPAQIGNTHTMRPVQAMGVRGFHLQSGHLGLEFLVGQAAAIHIAFPPKALPQMKDALSHLEKPQSEQKAH